jgi:hypothetical protein
LPRSGRKSTYRRVQICPATSINSLVQAAKAKARGYRSTRNLTAIVYLLAGKLDMRLPA